MHKTTKKIVISGIVLASLALAGMFNRRSYADSLTSVSDTLSNARLSFRGALTSANLAGTTQVVINTTPAAYPSTSTAQLVEGDVVRIGEAGSLASYTVASTSSLSRFTTTAVLAAGDADSGDDVISTISATHTVRFTTANAIQNGRFRILIPSLTDNGAAGDGIPDGGKFDFSTTPATVTCPGDVSTSVYDFVTGTASVSAITVAGVDYHAFECPYSGTGANATVFDGTTNGAITITGLINPAPATGHTTGTADAQNVIVQHIDSNFLVADATTVQVGIIEAVRVTATIPPQLTFKILGLAGGVSACGTTTTVTTTPASVPFGEIAIDAFSIAAQALTVSTNATNGFVVTAIENDQLGKDGAVATGDCTAASCIRDSIGNNSTMSHTTSDEWTLTTVKGFAYSLHDVNSTTTEAFAYSESSRTFSAKQFADEENSQTAQTIFSGTTVADNQNVYVCYKIVAAATNEAGFYENYLRYTATATF